MNAARPVTIVPLWAIVPELTLASAFLLLLVAAPFTSPRTTRAVYVSATAVLLVAAAFTVRMLRCLRKLPTPTGHRRSARGQHSSDRCPGHGA